MRQLSITPLTVPTLPPTQFLRCAAQAGFRRVAMRILQGTPRSPTGSVPMLVTGAHAIPELTAILAGEGLVVSELEFVLLDAHTPMEEYRPFLEIGAALGGRYIVACTMEPDLARAAEKLNVLNQMARQYGLKVVFEFARYTAIPTLQDAMALINASDSDDVGILLDSFHFYHAGHESEDILPYPSSLFPYVQLSDAAGSRPQDLADVIRQAREDRLNPGQGQIDLAAIVGNLPPDIPVSLEVPNLAQIAQVGALAHAIQVRLDAEQLLRRIDGA